MSVRWALRPSTWDRMMRGSNQRGYFENSGHFNFGYWSDGAKSQREASDALVDQLVARIANRTGRILDVACGLGGSTRRLMQTYPPEMITGINISDAQIADARALAPGCTFQLMDATKLDFPDSHFDAVICIEAACHFDTRDKFFKEAHRVLKPDGSLVLADYLFYASMSNTMMSQFGQVPRANLVRDIVEYSAGLATAGFVAIDVTDATDHCVGGLRANLVRWPGAERRAGRMTWSQSLAAAAICRLLAASAGSVYRTYVLVSARKSARLEHEIATTPTALKTGCSRDAAAAAPPDGS
jgi:MPBQ/MSBQ methyltransferase